MNRWTTRDIPDQRGRTVLITGASSGLGAAAAECLSAAGARVIMTCRDREKGDAVARRVNGDTEVCFLDLADLSSVRAFARDLDDELDVLVNNAGVMAAPAGVTADGFERHIGTNHLGPFLLTAMLIGRVRERVVTVTSGLHWIGHISTDWVGVPRRYHPWSRYAQSKLANLLFAYELDRRLCAAGTGIISVAAHPGVAATEGQSRDTSLLGRILAGGRPQSPAMGVLPLLYAATAREVAGGTCIGPDGFGQRTGHPAVVRTSRASHDAARAREVWARSEQLTGARYVLAARCGVRDVAGDEV